MKIKADDIAEALKDSKEVEVSKDHKQIRRAGNKALPAKAVTQERKRDTKAKDKEESKKEKQAEDSEVEFDEKGNPIFEMKDFENP